MIMVWPNGRRKDTGDPFEIDKAAAVLGETAAEVLRKHAGVFAGVWTAYAALAFATHTFLPWAPVALGAALARRLD